MKHHDQLQRKDLQQWARTKNPIRVDTHQRLLFGQTDRENDVKKVKDTKEWTTRTLVYALCEKASD